MVIAVIKVFMKVRTFLYASRFATVSLLLCSFTLLKYLEHLLQCPNSESAKIFLIFTTRFLKWSNRYFSLQNA